MDCFFGGALDNADHRRAMEELIAAGLETAQAEA